MRSVVLVSGEIFKDERIDALSQAFRGRKNIHQTVGWLVSVWACVLDKHPSGTLGYTRMAEIASEGLSGSLKPKADVVRRMIDAGLLRLVDSETVEVVGWDDWTGSIPKKRKRKAERQKRYRRKVVGVSDKNEQGSTSQGTENTQDTHGEGPKCRRLHEPNVDVYIAQPTENKEQRDESCRRLQAKNVDVYADGEGGFPVEGYVNQDVKADDGDSAGSKSAVSKFEYSNLINYNYNLNKSNKEFLIDSSRINLIDPIKNSSNSNLNCLNKKKKKTQKKEKDSKRYSASVAEVESGSCDEWPRSTSSKHYDVLSAFVSVHGDCFGTKLKPESQSVKKMAKQIVLTDGYTPSDVCKAIRGMATDTWVERRKFSGWSYLAKHFEKWLMMYSEGTSQADAGSWGPWRDEGFATRKDWEDYHGQK
jgi:hypothetical protein